jgi:hypothetical protein
LTSKTSARVLITPTAKRKLDLYIELAGRLEISGLGLVEQHPEGLLVEDVFIFKQECSPGETELDPKDLAIALGEMVEEGKDTEKVKLWWHSHASMGVFWSGTDDSTINDFNNVWMLSIVGNLKKEYRCRLDFYEPVRLTIDEIPLLTHFPEDVNLKAALEAEVKEKIDTPTSRVIIASPGGARYGSACLGEDIEEIHWRSAGQVPSRFERMVGAENEFSSGNSTPTPKVARIETGTAVVRSKVQSKINRHNVKEGTNGKGNPVRAE